MKYITILQLQGSVWSETSFTKRGYLKDVMIHYTHAMYKERVYEFIFEIDTKKEKRVFTIKKLFGDYDIPENYRYLKSFLLDETPVILYYKTEDFND